MDEIKKATRKPIPASLKREVLAEAGYRCAVPTCRGILALDLHHIEEVQEGGENILSTSSHCAQHAMLYTPEG